MYPEFPSLRHNLMPTLENTYAKYRFTIFQPAIGPYKRRIADTLTWSNTLYHHIVRDLDMAVTSNLRHRRLNAINRVSRSIKHLKNDPSLFTTTQHLITTGIYQHRATNLESTCLGNIITAIIRIAIFRLSLHRSSLSTSLFVLFHLLLLSLISSLTHCSTNHSTTSHTDKRADIATTWASGYTTNSRTNNRSEPTTSSGPGLSIGTTATKQQYPTKR